MRASTTALATFTLLTLAGCGGDDVAYDTPQPALEGGQSLAADGAWPSFGGPNGDFSVDAEGLALEWPVEGPPQVWSRALGDGYAGVSAADGVLFTGYRDGDDDVMIAIDAADGATVWEYRYAEPVRDSQNGQFGKGPNTTPLVLDDRVVTLGIAGTLTAIERAGGEMLWSTNLLDDMGGESPVFGYAASPVEHGGRVVVLVGGERGAVAALDPSDGTVIWRSPAGSVSYATPRVIDVHGREQLIYFSADEIVALDPEDGTRLWSHPVRNQYDNHATVPHWNGDVLWVATQTDGGTRALRLDLGEDGTTTVEEVWSTNRVSIHHWNSVLVGDYVYASIGGNASILAAVSLADGEIAWRERGFVKANLVHAGDVTLLLDEKGHLALVRLSPAGVEVLGQTRLVEGPAWTAPTLVGTTVYVRDTESIRALDLGAGGA